MSKVKTEVQFANTANPNKFVKRANGTIDKSKAYTSNIRLVAVGNADYQHPEELSKTQVKKMVDIRTKEAKDQGLDRVLFTADVDNTYYRDNRTKQVNTSEDGVIISYVYKTNVRPTQMGITL
tara:strand:- start:39 stop:407 length:369 start_codon:yes stop_codon:yes gene_type:complete